MTKKEQSRAQRRYENQLKRKEKGARSRLLAEQDKPSKYRSQQEQKEQFPSRSKQSTTSQDRLIEYQGATSHHPIDGSKFRLAAESSPTLESHRAYSNVSAAVKRWERESEIGAFDERENALIANVLQMYLSSKAGS